MRAKRVKSKKMENKKTKKIKRKVFCLFGTRKIERKLKRKQLVSEC